MEEEGRRGREAKSGGDRDKRERPWEERPVTEGRRHSKGLLIVIKSSQFSLGSMVLGWGLEPGFSLVGMMRRVTEICTRKILSEVTVRGQPNWS